MIIWEWEILLLPVISYDQDKWKVCHNEAFTFSVLQKSFHIYKEVKFMCGTSDDCYGQYSIVTELWDIFCKKVTI